MEDTSFQSLISMDFNKHVEVFNGFKYLSWSYAWAEIKKLDINANYEILENSEGLPFFESSVGFFVKTKVTFKGITHKMILPVLDFRNKAMKSTSYKYKNQKGFEFECKALDSFDINKAILRCLVKNIAVHGIGLYIFQGEDYPEKDITPPAPLPLTKKQNNVVGQKKVKNPVVPFDFKTFEKVLDYLTTVKRIEEETSKAIAENTLSEADVIGINSVKDKVIAKLQKKLSFFDDLKSLPVTECITKLTGVLKYYPDYKERIGSFIIPAVESIKFKTLDDAKAIRSFFVLQNSKLQGDAKFESFFEDNIFKKFK